MLVHNQFNFLCVCGIPGLEVTNAPSTAKALGSNLTTFFSNEIFPFETLSFQT